MKNAKCKKAVDVEAGTVTLAFSEGTVLNTNLDALQPDMVRQLALHGLSQKLGDSYSGSESVLDAIDKATTTWNSLMQNQWSIGRASAGSALAEAVSRATGQTLEDCVTAIAKLDDKQKRHLAKVPDVALELYKMKQEAAEKAAASAKAAGTGMDLTSLFD